MTNILYWLPEGAPDLARGSAGASGYDLRAWLPTEHDHGAESWPYWKDDGVIMTAVLSGDRRLVPTGLRLAMPFGVEAQIRGRSGLAVNHGILEFNGTIDSDYRGEIFALLFNLGREMLTISTGDRVAQLVFAPVIIPGHGDDCSWLLESWMRHDGDGDHPGLVLRRVARLEDLPPSDRGASGFGSTGVK